ncbi:hypothetical protein FACS189459_0930 [Bacilli bacterium]|nr:hypothetical protein FACS189459_0930 [Bacilli bacterium]
MHYHSIAPTSNISVTFSPDASGSTARKSNGDIDEELTTKLTTRAITFNGSTTPSSYTNAC